MMKTYDNDRVLSYVEILHGELRLIADQLTNVSKATEANLQYALTALDNVIVVIENEEFDGSDNDAEN